MQVALYMAAMVGLWILSESQQKLDGLPWNVGDFASSATMVV